MRNNHGFKLISFWTVASNLEVNTHCKLLFGDWLINLFELTLILFLELSFCIFVQLLSLALYKLEALMSVLCN